MPGYAKNAGGSSKSLVFSNGTQAYSEKFYGFNIDLSNGRLLIKEIDNKSEIITLPEDEGVYTGDYVHWIWSGTKLKFAWGEGVYEDRLIMEVT
jgi:hypothetical protein